jgi:hypothetical protein
VGAVSTRVDDTLRDALVIEVRDLLAQDEVLEEGWSSGPAPERVLVIGNDRTLVGCELLAAPAGDLV